jgi:hypothetical protein
MLMSRRVVDGVESVEFRNFRRVDSTSLPSGRRRGIRPVLARLNSGLRRAYHPQMHRR